MNIDTFFKRQSKDDLEQRINEEFCVAFVISVCFSS